MQSIQVKDYMKRHPVTFRADDTIFDAIEKLLSSNLTGGQFAAQRLAREYYSQYITAAQNGGMAAVCGTPHFRDLIDRARRVHAGGA